MEQLNALRDYISQLETQNRQLIDENKKLKSPTLPKRDEFGDDLQYQEAIIECMRSGKLSEEDVKEALFDLLASIDHDYIWIPEELFSTPNGGLWRIENGKLQVIIPRWESIDRLYDDNEIDLIGKYLRPF
jgi:hypothetical protein